MNRPATYPHVDLTVIQRMPTFVIAEVTFIIVAILSFIHALSRPSSSPSGRRRHLLLFIFAIIGGSCSDLLFMHLPIVDNFWHSQATIMLTERLPFYILTVYASFIYIPIASVWRCGLPIISEATLSGILAVFFYAPFDVVGAKFLWWTWHDSDTVVSERILNVPVSSTMWVGIYTTMFALLFTYFLPTTNDMQAKQERLSDGSLLYNGGISAKTPSQTNQRHIPLFTISSILRAGTASILAIPLMMLHMMIIQCIMGGLVLPPPPPPTSSMLGLTLVAYGSLCISSIADDAAVSNNQIRLERKQMSFKGSGGGKSYSLVFAIVFHYLMLLYVARYCDPIHSISTGIHQTYGPCNVKTTDYAGETCNKFVCDVLEHVDYKLFSCGENTIQPIYKNKELNWYTICGLPKNDAWVRSSTAYSISGLVMFTLLIGIRGISSTTMPAKRSLD